LRDQLKSGLSATAQMQDDEAGPSVSELAEKIKALKAAHNIEATPQRVRQKQPSAEEPVTARIRRRTLPAAGHAIPIDAVAPPGAPVQPESTAEAVTENVTPGISSGQPSTLQDSSTDSTMTFRDRISAARQRKEQEPRLP
jgi:hypothetical protein